MGNGCGSSFNDDNDITLILFDSDNNFNDDVSVCYY